MDDHIFRKFSDSAQEILLAAQEMAVALNVPTGTEHVLLSIAKIKGSLAHNILASQGATADKIQVVLNEDTQTSTETLPRLSEELKQALAKAMNLANQYGHVGLDTEHVLLGILSRPENQACLTLKKIGCDPDVISNQLINLFSEILKVDQSEDPVEIEPPPILSAGPLSYVEAPKKKTTPALDYFTTNLTKLASEGKLDPVIGRTAEIERVIKVLSRRTKNNPVLIGEPGVGKTAVVEGLAARIAANDVPAPLVGKQVLALDLASIVAGTMYRGQFEERIKKVIEELQKLNNFIVFIDELHTIMGAGSAEGSLDAAQILKPALAKGNLRLIGATTLDEYQKHVEKDAALTRRFQPIIIEEPSETECFAILQGLKSLYEQHHHVKISDEAIRAAIVLSERYIPDRFLPDKAIDLIDETAATFHLKNAREKNRVILAKQLEQLVEEKEEAVTTEQYETAATLQRKENSLRRAFTRLAPDAINEPVVTAKDIEACVKAITGVAPVSSAEDELIQIKSLEKELGTYIIGQGEAIQIVANAIRRARLGIGQTNRPVGSFIFLGPSGVGKSELAKVIAKILYGKEQALVKIDMSEFMERHNVSRLLGAPAGYIGYEEGGKLTETIRRQPHSVVLLDEIEKAHPDVFNVLLQIMEDGYVTDAKGRRIDFRHTIIIMTSNIGMEEFTRHASMGFNATTPIEEKAVESAYEILKNSVLKSLEEHFKPEFINRLDETIVFKPLTKDHLRQIIDLQIQELIQRLHEQGIKLQVDLTARRLLAEKGYDPKHGARPIRRLIQTLIEDKIAEGILNGTLDKNKTAIFRRKEDNFVMAV